MSLQHTHDLREDGEQIKVAQCHCSSCDNIWWVRALPEFQPSYCPYCGMKFLWYDGTDGYKYNLGGQKI